MGEIRKQILDLVAAITDEKGLELVAVEYKREGSDYFLRIFIDHPDGIGHHHCKEVSEELGTLLELYDLIPDPYILEVSSPGVERPLKNPEDYNRFKGKKIIVKTYGPINNRREWEGELLGFYDGVVRLRLEEEEMEIPMKQIAKSRLMAVDL